MAEKTKPGTTRAARILIVEDNPVTRKILRLALENENYPVYEADTGRAALNLAQAHRPRLIVQDLMLPDMDGFVLIKRLRALPAVGKISCISSFSVVVLPAPFGPSRPKISPRSTRIVSASRARLGRGRQKPARNSLVSASV